MEDPSWKNIKLIDAFNELTNPPRKFFPTIDMYKRWRRKWDDEIAQKIFGAKLSKIEKKIIVTSNERNELIPPSDNELEMGGKILAGELMNDAMNILKKDQVVDERRDEYS
ncbi:MAG: hypothetical protein DDT40_01185 [candidate division WS2 bacterium]|nr:hypothetical protein [Candidatus Psychracetigena formicireducens]